jgi:hypothetical protein
MIMRKYVGEGDKYGVGVKSSKGAEARGQRLRRRNGCIDKNGEATFSLDQLLRFTHEINVIVLEGFPDWFWMTKTWAKYCASGTKRIRGF